MIEKTATHQGVASRRAEAMAEVIRKHEEHVDREMKEGGQAEGISVLARELPADGSVAVVKPEGVDQAEWDGLSAEAKAGLAEAEAERVRAEAAAPDAERQRREADEKAKKDAEAATGKTKIKVDGAEQEVTDEQIREAGIRALQKESTGDKRLEEASRLFKEAKAMIDAAQAGAVQDPNKGGASLPHAGGSAVEVLSDEAFTEAVKKIQYGSEVEATAALKDIVAKAARSGQSEQLTLDRVAEMLDFREAARWAHDEFKDIFGDPKLKSLFSTEEKRIRAAGDMRPYRDIYKDIGDGLREWVKGKSPAPAPQKDVGTSLSERHERKASVVTIPSAAARLPAAPQPKEPSPSEVIDQMRKARRQA